MRKNATNLIKLSKSLFFKNTFSSYKNRREFMKGTDEFFKSCFNKLTIIYPQSNIQRISLNKGDKFYGFYVNNASFGAIPLSNSSSPQELLQFVDLHNHAYNDLAEFTVLDKSEGFIIDGHTYYIHHNDLSYPAKLNTNLYNQLDYLDNAPINNKIMKV